MGQKVNPIGLRLGINKSWDSIWYEDKKGYALNIHEDIRIQKFITKNHKDVGISKIGIERLADKINVNIHAARPGLLIGKKGDKIEKLKADLQKIGTKKVFVNIVEVKKTEKNSQLVAEQITNQLEGRFPYRRAVKQAIAGALRGGAEGIKIEISGRLNGAEMARTETYKEGRIPLHTLRADIDFGFSEALTSYGLTGVKVWVYNGIVLSNKKEAAEEDKYTVKRKTK
ncbi:MAG: 30S ribosomal protein S3 [Spirochaetota bacterium]